MKRTYLWPFIAIPALISGLVAFPNTVFSQIIQADQPLHVQVAQAAQGSDFQGVPGIPSTTGGGTPTTPTTNGSPGSTPLVSPSQTRPAPAATNPAQAPGARTAKPECTQNVALIFQDVENKNDPKNRSYEPKVPWRDLGWLEQSFGVPTGSNTVTQTIVHWDNFNVLVRDGLIVRTIGQYPGKIPPMMDYYPVYMGKVSREIGPPLNIVKENLTQFVWNCADSPSTLSVQTDDQGVVVLVSGIYCNTTNGCRSFGTLGDDSTALKRFAPQ